MNGKRLGPLRLFTDEQESLMCKHYWTRQANGFYPSYKETGDAFGCSAAHVRNTLKKHGIQRRTNAETRDGRPCKPINQPDGPAPLCACGCGTAVEWISKESRWQKFAPGHYRPKKQYHDPEWLRREYLENLRSIEEIAAQFDVCQSSVIKVMRKFSIQPRTLSDSLILRGSTRGDKNPAWKGGVAEWDYSPDWKRICKEIKDRDKWTCQHCNEQRTRWGAHLHVHHIDGNKLNNHPDNLISLCAKCHRKAHGAK